MTAHIFLQILCNPNDGTHFSAPTHTHCFVLSENSRNLSEMTDKIWADFAFKAFLTQDWYFTIKN